MKNKRWETDANWEKIPIEVLKFCHVQGEKRLDALINTGTLITQRSYSIIGFLMPVLAVCTGILIKATTAPWKWETLLSVLSIVVIIISLISLIRLIKARRGFEVGIEPKHIYIKEGMDFVKREDGEEPIFRTDEQALKIVYHNEMDQLQDKITRLATSNSNRSVILSKTIIGVFAATVILLLHIITIILL
ncbi:MAG: hypothetical protein ACXVPU_03130 [Bacteroidia bacterium]